MFVEPEQTTLDFKKKSDRIPDHRLKKMASCPTLCLHY